MSYEAEIGFEWGKPSKDGSHTFGRLLVWDGESWRIEPYDGAPGSNSYQTLGDQGVVIARVGQGDDLGCCMGDLPGLLECFCRHQLPEEFPTSFFISLLGVAVEAEERHQ